MVGWPNGQMARLSFSLPPLLWTNIPLMPRLHCPPRAPGLDHKAQTTEAGHLMSLGLSSPKSNNQKQKKQKESAEKRPSSCGNGTTNGRQNHGRKAKAWRKNMHSILDVCSLVDAQAAAAAWTVDVAAVRAPSSPPFPLTRLAIAATTISGSVPRAVAVAVVQA